MKSRIRKSFRNQIFVTVLLVTLVPLFLCSTLMLEVQVARTTENRKTQAAAELDTLESAFSGLLDQIDEVSQELSESTVVRSVLRNRTRDSRTLYQVLSRNTGSLQKLCRFDLFFATGACFYTTDPMLSPLQADPRWGILRAAGAENGLACAVDGSSGMKLGRAVRSFDGQILGYIVATVSRENLNTLFENTLSATSDLMIADRFWNPVYSSQTVGMNQTVPKLRQQILAGQPLSDPQGACGYTVRTPIPGGFSLILQQPRAFPAQALQTFHQVSTVVGVLCLILCLGYALYFSRYLANPVHQLDKAMEQVEKGDLSVHISMEREDELGRLAQSFNRMIRECQANLDRSVDRQKQLNSTQLRMMQAQLNPHFLYNTLDSIKWLGVTGGVPEISSMATDLAAILRDSISGEPFVTLEQELEIIDRYLEIQYIRYENRFVCEMDIPERFQHCLLPKLSLQPLVENAILHGVADLEEGYIKISARQEGEDLILCVADNGQGIPEELLSAINSPDGRIPGRHLGLGNVNQIARLHYGPGYGVTAESIPGAGSRVYLKIPMKTEEPLHAENSDC